MTENETILEFIDGSLDSDSEQELFNAMARHPEMRIVLRQYIAISEGVHSDREAFAPPAYVEQALMTGLGLVPLAGAATSGAVATGIAGWLAKLGNLWLLVAAFMVGSVAAGSGTYLLMQQPDTPQQSRASVTNTQLLTVQPSVTQSTSVPSQDMGSNPAHHVSTSSGKGAISTTPPSMSASVDKTSTPQPALNSTMAQNVDGKELTNVADGRSGNIVSIANGLMIPDSTIQHGVVISRTTIRPALDVSNTIAPDTSVSQLHRDRVPVDVSPILLSEPEQTESTTTFIIELRKQSVAQLVTNGALNVQSSWLQEDVAGAAYWRASKTLMVGVEVGKERYSQTLGVFHEDTLVIEQKPSYLWGGLALRYNFENSIPLVDVRPFFQVTGGITSAGPMARLRLGGTYLLPFSPLGFDLMLSGAFEASSLVYAFRGEQQMAGRGGFTGGLEIGF